MEAGRRDCGWEPMVCTGVPTGTDACPRRCLADADPDAQSPEKPEQVGRTNLGGQLPWLPNEEPCRTQNVQPGSAGLRDEGTGRLVEHGVRGACTWVPTLRGGPVGDPWHRHVRLPGGSGQQRWRGCWRHCAIPAGLGAGGRHRPFFPKSLQFFSYLMQHQKDQVCNDQGQKQGRFLCKKLQLF